MAAMHVSCFDILYCTQSADVIITCRIVYIDVIVPGIYWNTKQLQAVSALDCIYDDLHHDEMSITANHWTLELPGLARVHTVSQCQSESEFCLFIHFIYSLQAYSFKHWPVITTGLSQQAYVYELFHQSKLKQHSYINLFLFQF